MSGIMAWGNPPPAPDPMLDRNGCHPGRGISSTDHVDYERLLRDHYNQDRLAAGFSHPAHPSVRGRPRSINTVEIDAARQAEMAAQKQRALDLAAARAEAARLALVASIRAAANSARRSWTPPAKPKPKPKRRVAVAGSSGSRPAFVVGQAKPAMRLTRKLSVFRPPKEPR